MELPVFTAAVGAVDWLELKSTYGSGEIVRDIILALASGDQARVSWAWEQIGETVLQHQGTVYPATAAAAPFLCQLALAKTSLSRAELITELAFLATGYDTPYSPAGTAMAVRDGIRPYLRKLLALWGTAGAEIDLALVALSVAFPDQAPVIAAGLRSWFGRSGPPLRTGLALALGFHGLAGDAAGRIVLDEVRESTVWLTSSGRVAGQGPVPDASRFGPDEELTMESPLSEALQVAERLRAGAGESAVDFSPVFSFLLTLLEHRPPAEH